MSIHAQAIVDEALSWVGTPWAHQQAIKGVGADCAGFLGGVARATYATPDVNFETNYRRREDGQTMFDELTHYTNYVGSARDTDFIKPADVIAFHDGFNLKEPSHLAFASRLVPYLKMVHASERGIRHHRLDIHLRSKIHSIWRVPNLIY